MALGNWLHLRRLEQRENQSRLDQKECGYSYHHHEGYYRNQLNVLIIRSLSCLMSSISPPGNVSLFAYLPCPHGSTHMSMA